MKQLLCKRLAGEAYCRRRRMTPGVKVVLAAAGVMIVCASGCHIQKDRVSVVKYRPAENSGFDKRIEKLERALSAMSGKSAAEDRVEEKAEILLKLAMCYAHPENPSLDINRAVECLKRYKAMETRQAVDAEYVIGLLHRLQQCRKACQYQKTRVIREKQALEKRCRELQQENREKTEIIEKLKHLDIQLENRRQSFDR